MMPLQIFCPSRLPSAVFQPPPRPHSAAPRRMRSSALSASRRFTLQLGRRRIHGGAAVRIERILNLSDISVFGKKYPSFSRRRLPQIPYPAFRYLTLNPRGLAWPATRNIGLGRARVKLFDGDLIECTVKAAFAILPTDIEHRRGCFVGGGRPSGFNVFGFLLREAQPADREPARGGRACNPLAGGNASKPAGQMR